MCMHVQVYTLTAKYKYVHVCTGMYMYLQVCERMYRYVHVCKVCTGMYMYVRYVNVCTGMSPVTHPLRGSTLILLGLSPYVARVAISVPLLVSTISELLTSSTK